VFSSSPGPTYAILSKEGVTRVFGKKVDFVTQERFIEETKFFNRLRKINFFRYYYLRKSWLLWRRSIRSRRIEEVKKNISSHFLLVNIKARNALVKISQLCYEMSKRCLA
ncbi:hypothetical protein Anas_03907, partial [Armadillidium nasatum]